MAKKTTPKTAYQILSEVRLANGKPLDDRGIVTAACSYLDAQEGGGLPLELWAERLTLVNFPGSWFTHHDRLDSVLAVLLAAGLAIDADTQATLVCEFVDSTINNAKPVEAGAFTDWLFSFLDMEPPDDFEVQSFLHNRGEPVPRPTPAQEPAPAAKTPRTRKSANDPLPGQQSLPLNGKSDAEAALRSEITTPVAKKTKSWVGKRIKYRHAKGWVLGVVTLDDDITNTVKFNDDKGEPWTVGKDRCKLIREKKDAEPDAEEEKDEIPVVTVTIPKKDVTKYTKLLEKAVYVKAADDVMAVYHAPVPGGQHVYVAVTNGDADDKTAPFVDIYVMMPGKVDGLPTFSHEPVETLLGSYEITVRNKPMTLEVVSA